MFADPQSVTISGSAKSLARIRTDNYSSEYALTSATDRINLNLRNYAPRFDKKRGVSIIRHNVELIQTVFPVAPSTISYVRKAYITFEAQEGDTLTDPAAVVSALAAYLTSANITKLMNSES
jgi:hypothetical protein